MTSSRLCTLSSSLEHTTPLAIPSSPLQQASANPLTTATAQPAHQTALAATTKSAYKKIATIAKVYIDKQKYNRFTNFDYKLTIFYNICKRSGLSCERYITVFLTILKRLAKEHYYSSNLADRLFKDTCIHIRNFFKGPEYYRKNLTK
jgi:hypothetical protein